MNASTEKFAGINLLPWNVKSPAGRWLSSMQQAAICQARAEAASPYPACPSAAELSGLGFYLFSSLKGEFSPSASFSSWIKLPDPGKGRSLFSPAVGAEALPPGGRVSHPRGPGQNIRSKKLPTWELTDTDAPSSLFTCLPIFADPVHFLIDRAPQHGHRFSQTSRARRGGFC